MENGIIITGIFCGSKGIKKRNFETNVETNKYQYVLVDGVDTYRITSDYDYSGSLAFGDQVSFKVSVNAFNGNIYYKGDLIA